jgi:hypothetical protein
MLLARQEKFFASLHTHMDPAELVKELEIIHDEGDLRPDRRRAEPVCGDVTDVEADQVEERLVVT